MNTDDALAFLEAHQPMPGDFDITDEEGKTYADIIEHFEEHPDLRCVPLLVNSVSKNTGLGMYEHIKFVLKALPREDVVPHLRQGLLTGNDGVEYRCCWWATEVDAWEFEDIIRPLMGHDDDDISDAAESFCRLKEELA